MKCLKIEVFEDDTKEATIKIPVAVLNVASKLFPKKYLSSMEKNDVSFANVLEAANKSEESGFLVEIEDHRDNERVVISID